MGKNERVRECKSEWRGEYVCIRMRERVTECDAECECVQIENMRVCVCENDSA